MTTHRYPVATLYPDYLRAGFGLALTAGPVLLLDLATATALVLSGLALLFGWFGLRTALRQMCWIELSSEAIAIRGPLSRHLSWEQLARLKLAYYAPRSGRSSKSGGWLQLTLRGARGRPIRVESTLDGFDHVLRRALSAVARQGLSLDPTTSANLAALGLERDGSATAALKPSPSARDLAPGPRPKGYP